MIKQGQNCQIYESAYLDDEGEMEIGNNVYIGIEAVILNHTHKEKEKLNYRKTYPTKLVIEDYVYIGYRVMVLSQVSLISEGSLIGAGSVLTKNTMPYEIWAGNPAKCIGLRKNEQN